MISGRLQYRKSSFRKSSSWQIKAFINNSWASANKKLGKESQGRVLEDPLDFRSRLMAISSTGSAILDSRMTTWTGAWLSGRQRSWLKNFSSPLSGGSAKEVCITVGVKLDFRAISNRAVLVKQGNCVKEEMSAVGYQYVIVEERIKEGGDGLIRASCSELSERFFTSMRKAILDL